MRNLPRSVPLAIPPLALDSVQGGVARLGHAAAACDAGIQLGIVVAEESSRVVAAGIETGDGVKSLAIQDLTVLVDDETIEGAQSPGANSDTVVGGLIYRKEVLRGLAELVIDAGLAGSVIPGD